MDQNLHPGTFMMIFDNFLEIKKVKNVLRDTIRSNHNV